MKSTILSAALIAGSLLIAAQAHAASGKDVYKSACAGCHDAGMMGALKLTDKAGWAPHLLGSAKPMHTLAIKGKGMMPPKGGKAALSDADVIAAVDYMLAQAKLAGASSVAPKAAAASGKKDAVASVKPAPVVKATAVSSKGKDVYKSTCAGCHDAGMGLKLTDKAGWAPHLAGDAKVMHSLALKGKGMMQPKGGNAALSDADVIAAVDYMLSQAKLAK